MMLLHRLKFYGIFISILLIVIVSCIARNKIAKDKVDRIGNGTQRKLQSLRKPQSIENKNKEQDLANIFKAFNETLKSEEKNSVEIFNQWEDYILSATHYSNEDHADAINKQLSDYYKAIAEIGHIIDEKRTKQKREYSSSWTDDLVNHFGMKIIKKNRDALLQIWKTVFATDEAYENKFKDLIYIETMLFGSCQTYFGLFLSFYNEELDDSVKVKIEAQKNIAESFLKLIDQASIAAMHQDTVLRRVLADNKARLLNEELYLFLKNHPLFHTFGDPRAFKDLRTLTDN